MDKKIQSLIEEIGSIVNTPALEVVVNKESIEKLRNNLEKVSDDNFNKRISELQRKLSPTIFSNSSVASGVCIAISRERCVADIDNTLKITEYAETLKADCLTVKQTLLDSLLLEKDKKRQVRLKYCAMLSSSIVLVAIIRYIAPLICTYFST